ncbi:Crp/Fnr family transcriptional regulator [Hymenobacter terrenus]|uniref:Crp/Fnr family transcriptional regulator n=1 Tax=Hymenobacter terrenus TaxID=1629124 RepID=UPI00061975C6|nr:Crp/Fnr family transcriptional regulator [Hymenobacter terrenus]
MTAPNTEILAKAIQQLSATSAASLAQLCIAAAPRVLSKREALHRAGKPCESVWFVEKGYLRAFQADEAGRELNHCFYLENSFATDLVSLRTHQPSVLTLQAGEPTLVWEWPKQRLLDLYATSIEAAQFGRMLLGYLLLKQERQTRFFQHYGPAERYAHLLREQPALVQRVSVSQLASYLGMARETLSRLRSA